MKILSTVILLVFVSVGTIKAQTQVDSKFGKGLMNVVAADSSWSMKFGLRIQNLFVAEYDLNDSLGLTNGSSNFLVRRSRLKFDGFAYSPKLKYKIELGLTNRDISGGIDSEHKFAPRVILDAVVKWNFYGNFSIWAGQTKLPGNRERVVSSANLQFVDRSFLNKRYNIDRDMGFQLRHHFNIGDMIVKEIVSVSQGEGRNITSDNIGGYDYTGRIEFLPMGKFDSKGKDDYVSSCLKRQESPKLAIGVTYDYHDRAVRTGGQLGDFMYNDNGYYETDVTTLFADMMFKYKGVSVMVEYADKKADDAIAKNSDGSETGDKVYVGTGLNAQLGYLFKNNWEVAGRYTSITPDKSINKNDHTQYTLGVSKYVVGHKLKVQSDISYYTEENKDDAGIMARLQVELHF